MTGLSGPPFSSALLMPVSRSHHSASRPSSRVVRALGPHVTLLAILVAGCGSDSETDPTGPGTIPVASVEVTPAADTVLPTQTTLLQATLRDANGNILPGRAVSWSSDAEGVAVVNDTGLVTGAGAGTATITATSEGQSGQAVISVPEGTFVGSAGGEVVAANGNVRLQIPAGALPTGAAIRVTSVSPPPEHPDIVWGTTFTIGPSGVDFAEPATLTIRYAIQDAASAVDEDWFRIHRWTGSEWAFLTGGSVERTPRLVTVPIRSTGTFGIIEATPNPVPVVTELLPAGSRQGSGAFVLSVRGQGFVPESEVWWNGAARETTFLSATELEAAIGAGDLAEAGSASVTVRSPEPAGGSSGVRPFEVLPAADPEAPGVSAGSSHGCAVTFDGSPYCWGRGESGRTGTGSTAPALEPTTVQGGHSFAAISAGGAHSCALTSEGAAWCWGLNDHGSVGDGTTTPRMQPVPVAGGHSFERLVTGSRHTCALKAGGEAWCWGRNNEGQLGNGSQSDALTPQPVSGGHSFSVIRPSPASEYTCGVDTDGALWCWGRNTSEQLGDGTTTRRLTPVRVLGDRSYTTVSVGSTHACALATDGRAWCWGRNFGGRVGDGTQDPRPVPVEVVGGRSFIAVAVGHDHSCALTDHGEAWCWGSSGGGALGDGTGLGSLVPVRVAAEEPLVSISAGSSFTCGVTETGRGLCWGSGSFGRLGSGTTTNRLSPFPIAGGLVFR